MGLLSELKATHDSLSCGSLNIFKLGCAEGIPSLFILIWLQASVLPALGYLGKSREGRVLSIHL